MTHRWLPTETRWPGLRPKRIGLTLVSAKGEVLTSPLLETPDAGFVGTLHQQLMALGNAGDWTFETRVVWLDHS